MTVVTPEVQQQSSLVSSGFISNMFNPNPDAGIDSILNLNIKSTSLVDVPFEDRVKALEHDFWKFNLTNLFAKAISSIPGIVDTYLANKMDEAVKTTIQLQSDRLRDESQAKHEEFNNKLDENIKKIIKEPVKVQVKEQVSKILPRIKKFVNEQLEAEVLTCSSNEAKTSYAIAANLSELKLKKILIEKMESNKSIHKLAQQKTLYKALIDAFKIDKVILETYEDTVTFKRRRDDKDEDKEPSTGLNQGSKRRRAGKEPKSTSAPKEKTSKSIDLSKEGSKSKTRSTDKSAQAKEEVHTVKDLEEPAHQEFEIGITEDHTVDKITQHPDWFQKPAKPPTPDPGPTFELMKGSCKSLVELEYFLEEVYKATTDQLDWNPEGQQYPHDLRKPLSLIPNL
nr:hypothetical protein [Tanacetum cinerariifolium]